MPKMSIEDHAKDLWNDLEYGCNDADVPNEQKIKVIQEKLQTVINEDREANQAVGAVFGSIFAGGFQLIRDRIIDSKKAMEIEREACAKIAENPIKIPDEPGKIDQYAWPGHPIMKAIAKQIRARGEKT